MDWPPGGLLKALARSLVNTTVLVAVQDDEVGGVRNLDLRGKVPVMWKLYVVPEVQGSGVGSGLMHDLLSKAPVGCSVVRPEYLDGNDSAARFYSHMKFIEVRREPIEQPGWPEVVWVERSL